MANAPSTFNYHQAADSLSARQRADNEAAANAQARAAGYAGLHDLVLRIPSPFQPVVDPFAMTEITRRYMEVLAHAAESLVAEPSDRYPHVCPRCSGPAYVGAVEVDCAGGCK